MRKLVLQKNLEMGGKLYQAGEEVELEDDVYRYIVNSYVESRRIEAEELAKKEEEMNELVKKASKGRK